MSYNTCTQSTIPSYDNKLSSCRGGVTPICNAIIFALSLSAAVSAVRSREVVDDKRQKRKLYLVPKNTDRQETGQTLRFTAEVFARRRGLRMSAGNDDTMI